MLKTETQSLKPYRELVEGMESSSNACWVGLRRKTFIDIGRESD
jgi:hypothetical protein